MTPPSRLSARWMPLLLTAALAASACTLHEVDVQPRSNLTLPGAFQTASGGKLDPVNRWWLAFEDPQLTALIDATVKSNLDIKRAWARIAQMRAIAKASGAAAYPQVTASAGLGASQGVNPLKDMPGEDHFAHRGNYSLSVAASYEVDMWGRVSSTRNAASYDVQAARQDVSALAMTMSAQAVEAWFSIAEAKAQLKLIEAQRDVNQTYLTVLEDRFKFGQADSVSIFQQRLALASSITQVPLLKARIRLLQYQLALFQGKAPGTFKAEPPAVIPQLPPPPATGIPADMLKNRPDVRAAQLRIVAADYKVGAAIADQYPALRLTASTGLQATDAADFITGWVWNLLANLVAPLFDGGRRAAEVERTQAVVTDLVHAYGATILKALKEVEDALVQETQQRQYVVRLDEQVKLANATLGEARSRYLEGGGDYLSVLNALAATQRLELSQLSARRGLLTYRVALYRALGGRWANELKAPAPQTAPKNTSNPKKADPTVREPSK